jgi:N6-L-threonylcarbamoyladenine synthase
VLLLGIETSCDDTATAVVRDGTAVLSNVSTNQDLFHAKYGGIVPEIASRQHLALLSAAVEDALDRAATRFEDLDGIAVTAGPGLVGSLVIGVATAKALAFATGKPLYAINHLHGHVFAAFLETDVRPEYPFVTLLVSGGHSQVVRVDGPTRLRVLGRTRDDAAGEAFDKTARLLGLPFPGGPAVDALARGGDARAIRFPRHRPERGSLDMSFSGPKGAPPIRPTSPLRSKPPSSTCWSTGWSEPCAAGATAWPCSRAGSRPIPRCSGRSGPSASAAASARWSRRPVSAPTTRP